MTVLLEGKKVRIPTPKLLTYADYARLTPPDSGNYELNNGKIIFIPTPIYQRISRKLSTRLDTFIEKNKCGEMFTAPMDTIFTPHDTLQPDILFIDKNRLEIIAAKNIEGVPDFIIEIVSPGNSKNEISYKRYIYESSGVREYWLIHPEKQSVTQYENIENELVRLNVLNIDDLLKSKVVEGFEIKVREIFE